MPHPVMKETREKMDKCVDAFHEEMNNIRSGRATAGLLDVVEVEVYGSRMKLNQLATVTAPDPNLLVVDLWDKSQITVIEKAIMQSPLGLNPSNDGKVIRLPIPPLSEERRRELVKAAKEHVEEAKIAVRNVRRHAIEQLKKLQKDGELPEDDAHRMTDEVQKLTDNHIEMIDNTFKAKEEAIMEV